MPNQPRTRHLLLAAAISVPLLALAQAPGKPAATPAAAPKVVAGPPVAGYAPDRRPAGAPVIREAVTSPDLLAYRLHGVEQPVPDNVMQAAQQGSHWYMALFRPGMTGLYDLRHWHPTTP